MDIAEVRDRYLRFFKAKAHTEIPSASLVPQNDPTTLLTGSGMQPLIPYLLGQVHPNGTRLVNSQKCFRAEDIEEVGDNRHTTFFEMLGNWSLGDYFKEEQLSWIFEFLTEELSINPEKLFVTCFIGDEAYGLEKDQESSQIWQKLFKSYGIEAGIVELGNPKEGSEKGMQGGRIFFYASEKNWWSRSGTPKDMPVGEIGGPDSEIFYDFGIEHDKKFGENCHPNCECGRFMEIGNSVFMQYRKEENGFIQLPKKNVDFGGGLERICAAVNNDADIFQIPILKALIEITAQSSINYEEKKRELRIIADHLRAAVFMLNDGIKPTNKERGYVLRRLIRRLGLIFSQLAGEQTDWLEKAIEIIAKSYEDQYPEIIKNKELIYQEIDAELKKFFSLLKEGEKVFEKFLGDGVLSGENAFKLFTTYGFPLDMTIALAKARGIKVDVEGFNQEFEKHQEVSKSDQKFKGGLADHSEKSTALHTATHLLLAGLRKYLGEEVHQAGSNITSERTRFDFHYPQKLSPEILSKVEDYVNEAISKNSKVEIRQMSKKEAKEKGVEGSFWEKYSDLVNVYTIVAPDGTIYSQELRGGPHVNSTSEIRGKFKIIKEESSSAGIRRIKAVLE